MSIPKQKLHELIDNLPENETAQVLKFLEEFIESKKKNIIQELYSNPLKYDDEIIIPSREERNAR